MTTQTDTDALVERRSKPCPLCGATALHGLTKVENCQLHGEPFQRFAIWCPKGHARVVGANEQIANREWNNRPEAATQAAQIAVLTERVRVLQGVLREIGSKEGKYSRKAGLHATAEHVLRAIKAAARTALKGSDQ